jgi:hypothetical protein
MLLIGIQVTIGPRTSAAVTPPMNSSVGVTSGALYSGPM